jgi:hypothetical protein
MKEELAKLHDLCSTEYYVGHLKKDEIGRAAYMEILRNS